MGTTFLTFAETLMESILQKSDSDSASLNEAQSTSIKEHEASSHVDSSPNAFTFNQTPITEEPSQVNSNIISSDDIAKDHKSLLTTSTTFPLDQASTITADTSSGANSANISSSANSSDTSSSADIVDTAICANSAGISSGANSADTSSCDSSAGISSDANSANNKVMAINSDVVAEARAISSYEDFCNALKKRNPLAELSLQLTNLYLRCAITDPMTGQGLYLDLPHYLNTWQREFKATHSLNEDGSSDRLSWIWDFISDSVRYLIQNPNTSLVRDHSLMIASAAHEFDNTTMRWLATKPGKYLVEKLQGTNNRILAATRRNEINTLENRLFKELVGSLKLLFELKGDALNVEDKFFGELSSKVSAWLRSDEASEIQRWDNLPPNNSLLSDRHYHKIWLAWNWLKNLDETIQDDLKNLDLRFLHCFFWSFAASLHKQNGVSILALPCEFDVSSHYTSVYWPKVDATLASDTNKALPIFKLQGRIRQNKSNNYFDLSLKADSKIVCFSCQMLDDEIVAFVIECKLILMKVADTYKDELIELIANKVSLKEFYSTVAKFQGVRGIFSLDLSFASIEPAIALWLGFINLKATIAQDAISATTANSGIVSSLAAADIDDTASYNESSTSNESDTIPLASVTVSEPSEDTLYRVDKKEASSDTTFPNEVSSACKTIDISMLDISTWQPRCKNNDGEEFYPDYRFLAQEFQHPNLGSILLDLSQAHAVLHDISYPICTTSDVFFNNNKEGFDASFISKSLHTYLSKLQPSLHCDRLYYIIPDGLEEFALKTLYSHMRHVYKDSLPLPRSIASAIAYQHLNPNDFPTEESFYVNIISLLGDKFVVTPVKRSFDHKLKAFVPSSNGYLWERYPSTIVDAQNLQVFNKICQTKPELALACNLSPADLMSSKSDLLLLHSAGDANVNEALNYESPQDFWQSISLNKALANKVSERIALTEVNSDNLSNLVTKEDAKNHENYFLFADCPVAILPKDQQKNVLGHVNSLDASKVLYDYETAVLNSKKDDVAYLWKDHLPQLYLRASQNGSLSYVPLVSESTILPIFGKTVHLSTCKFTLPASSSTSYHFPLSKNDGGEKMRYEVQLRSNAFPLEKETPCILNMSYTYGAETPYTLSVTIAGDKSSTFDEIKTEWIDAKDIVRPSPVPILPKAPDHLSELKSVKKGHTNLKSLLEFFEICKKNIEFVQGEQIASLNANSYENTAIFVDGTDVAETFFLNGDSYKCRLGNVTYSLIAPEVILSHINKALQDVKPLTLITTINRNRRTLHCYERFPVAHEKTLDGYMTFYQDGGNWRRIAALIWGKGRTIEDLRQNLRYDSPRDDQDAEQLERFLKEEFPNIVKAYLSNDKLKSSKVGKTLLTICASMHSDAPLCFYESYINKITSRKDVRTCTFIEAVHLGLAIGRINHDHQQSVLNFVFKLAKKKTTRDVALKALATFYNNQGAYLSTCISKSDVEALINFVMSAINEFIYDTAAKKLDPTTRAKRYCQLSEVIFFLLLTRHHPDPKVRDLMNSNRHHTMLFAEAIETAIDDCVQNHLTIKTFLRFALKKPSSRRLVPDLLYAVHLWLTGDDGSQDIKITSIETTM